MYENNFFFKVFMKILEEEKYLVVNEKVVTYTIEYAIYAILYEPDKKTYVRFVKSTIWFVKSKVRIVKSTVLFVKARKRIVKKKSISPSPPYNEKYDEKR